jgi:thiosulfate reductase cytochrome b subunit
MQLVHRHKLFVRIAHWVNVLCLAILLLSGLQIFNAHPALYWGADSDFDNPIFSMTAEWNEADGDFGAVNIFGTRFVTTGIFGVSEYGGRQIPRGFPSWATLPAHQDLSAGRVWHFFFAWLFVINGLFYLGFALATRHFSRRLIPTRSQLKSVGRSIRDHITFKFRNNEDVGRYNVIQKLAYLIVVLVLLPLVVLTGLTMSPAINAAAPWLLDIFGERQSARTIHFLLAFSLVLFVLVHVGMVVLSGFFNHMRAMITGWYAVKADKT